MLFETRDIFIFGVVAGLLGAGGLFAWPWGRLRGRFLVGGVATFLGFIAWNLTLNHTKARGFNVDAPVIQVSWADSGSGVMRYDPTSHRIYVAVQTKNELVVIDPSTDQIVDRYDMRGCDEPHGLLIDSGQEIAFVACQNNAKLVVFDLQRKRVTETHDTGNTPDVLAADPALHLVYVAAEDGVLATFAQENSQLRTVAMGFVGPNAHAVAVDPGTHAVYLPLTDVDGHPVLREMAIASQRTE